MSQSNTRRSISVSPDQDAFMERLARRNKWSRSVAYREVVERYMEASRFVDRNMPEGQELIASGTKG